MKQAHKMINSSNALGKKTATTLTQLEMLHHVNVEQQMFAMHL